MPWLMLTETPLQWKRIFMLPAQYNQYYQNKKLCRSKAALHFQTWLRQCYLAGGKKASRIFLHRTYQLYSTLRLHFNKCHICFDRPVVQTITAIYDLTKFCNIYKGEVCFALDETNRWLAKQLCVV